MVHSKVTHWASNPLFHLFVDDSGDSWLSTSYTEGLEWGVASRLFSRCFSSSRDVHIALRSRVTLRQHDQKESQPRTCDSNLTTLLLLISDLFAVTRSYWGRPIWKKSLTLFSVVSAAVKIINPRTFIEKPLQELYPVILAPWHRHLNDFKKRWHQLPWSLQFPPLLQLFSMN